MVASLRSRMTHISGFSIIHIYQSFIHIGRTQLKREIDSIKPLNV